MGLESKAWETGAWEGRLVKRAWEETAWEQRPGVMGLGRGASGEGLGASALPHMLRSTPRAARKLDFSGSSADVP